VSASHPPNLQPVDPERLGEIDFETSRGEQGRVRLRAVQRGASGGSGYESSAARNCSAVQS
jgi:hypothetical protein